jgi:preprotein translocase subunit SecE
MASKGFLEKTKKFLREVRAELRKVNWPNWNELLSYTAVVLVTVVFVGVFIGVVDLLFSQLIAPIIIR